MIEGRKAYRYLEMRIRMKNYKLLLFDLDGISEKVS